MGTVTVGHARSRRRLRQRRVVKIMFTVVFAVIWVPITIIMLAASVSDRRA